MIRRGNTGAKDGKSREVKTYRLLCPIRSQCCTNYNAPTGNLDSKTSREILDILKFTNQKYKQTILLVTHDEKIALKANRIITIGDGKIIKDEVMK